MVIELTDSNFEATINNGVTLVDFWAPWCGPCRMIHPIMDQLSEEYDDKITVGKLNVDENSDVSVKYAIRSIPTVMIFKDGEVVWKHVGVTSKHVFAEQLDSAL